MDWNLALEIFGTIIGLIYLYYEYKAHPLLWVMSIIMPAISIGVYFNAGLYADMGINIYYILQYYTNSNVPFGDALTTALSFIAMWMLARKYIEQWILWIVGDALSVGLYIYKGIYFYAGLYALYAIIAVFGYINWR